MENALSFVAVQSWFTGPCANIEDTGNQIVINCGDNSPLQRVRHRIGEDPLKCDIPETSGSSCESEILV